MFLYFCFVHLLLVALDPVEVSSLDLDLDPGASLDLVLGRLS
jgi:hypothetical protein